MTQKLKVIGYLVDKDIAKRVEIHEDTGICQNSLGVVLKRLTEKNLINQIEEGIYETNSVGLIDYQVQYYSQNAA